MHPGRGGATKIPVNKIPVNKIPVNSGTTESAPGAAIDPSGAEHGPAGAEHGGHLPPTKVATKPWQRRVLLFDGLLIALLGWLLWTLYTDDSEVSAPQKTQLEVDAPAVTPLFTEGSPTDGGAPAAPEPE